MVERVVGKIGMLVLPSLQNIQDLFLESSRDVILLFDLDKHFHGTLWRECWFVKITTMVAMGNGNDRQNLSPTPTHSLSPLTNFW